MSSSSSSKLSSEASSILSDLQELSRSFSSNRKKKSSSFSSSSSSPKESSSSSSTPRESSSSSSTPRESSTSSTSKESSSSSTKKKKKASSASSAPSSVDPSSSTTSTSSSSTSSSSTSSSTSSSIPLVPAPLEIPKISLVESHSSSSISSIVTVNSTNSNHQIDYSALHDDLLEAITFTEADLIPALREKLMLAEKIISLLLPVVSSLSLLSEAESKESLSRPSSPKPPSSPKKSKAFDFSEVPESHASKLDRKGSLKEKKTSQGKSLGITIAPPTGRRKSIAAAVPFPPAAFEKEKVPEVVVVVEQQPEPPPLFRRRTRSLLEVGGLENLSQTLAQDLVIDVAAKGKSSLVNQVSPSPGTEEFDPENKGWSYLDLNAAKIQRWYRYQMVRRHFMDVIKQAKKQNKAAKKKRTVSSKKKKIRPHSTTDVDELRVTEANRLEAIKAEMGEETEGSGSPSPGKLQRLASEPLRANQAMLFKEGSWALISPLSSLEYISTSSSNLEKSEPRRHYFTGVYKFNESPEKGIKYLIDNFILEEDEEVIAKFLSETDRLSKEKVGDYISLGKDLTNRVLECFVQLLDFSGLSFDQALRKLLSEANFRLPGEAQKIDRIMTEFGRQFHSYEPKIFDSEDTAYILAFSTIMLNTDAHNPSVKRKMTLKDFLRNNSGIDNGKNLPEDFLTKIYNTITQNEIKMKEPDETKKILEGIDGIEPAAYLNNHRKFIKEFGVQYIPDIFARNIPKPERTIYLFSDLLIITKMDKKKRVDQIHNLYRMRLEELKNLTVHQNVLELCNTSGRLITIAFKTPDDMADFILRVKSQIEEVFYYDPTRLQLLKDLTAKKLGEESPAQNKDSVRFKALANLMQYRNTLRKKSRNSIQADAKDEDSPADSDSDPVDRNNSEPIPSSPLSSDPVFQSTPAIEVTKKRASTLNEDTNGSPPNVKLTLGAKKSLDTLSRS